MSTAAELLAAFVRDGSQAAFAELVQRHVDLVYRAALRHTSAMPPWRRRSRRRYSRRSLPRATVPVAWLYATTRHHARNALALRTPRSCES